MVVTALPIYLDHHATTPVDPRVLEAMRPYFTEKFGNPGSVVHGFGEEARQAVDAAQASLAAGLHCDPQEIVFTSGATESNNLAIRGVAERKRRRGNHIVSLKIEHPAVLDPLARLAEREFEVTLLNVEPHGSPQAGCVDPQAVADTIREDTCLVSVMLANHEIGTIEPLAEIGRICKERGVLLHTDATQAVGKIPLDVEELQVDLLSFSGHKIYGPKGIGALYVRRRNPIVRLEPQITGGGQQGGRRSGTLNTPGIVGLAKAFEICIAEMEPESLRLAELRDQLWTGLTQEVPDAVLCGPNLSAQSDDGRPLRLPHNLNVAFPGLDGEALMLQMPGLAVSSGAACSSTDPEPSHVLRALGIPSDLVRATLRFGLGRETTAEEIETAIESVAHAVGELKSMGE